MKLDFNVAITGLDGISLKDGEGKEVLLSKTLANLLATSQENANTIKYFDWAVKVHNEGFIEVDKSDKELLTNFIKSSSSINTLGKGRLLQVIENGK